jgi:hypothetical protein
LLSPDIDAIRTRRARHVSTDTWRRCGNSIGNAHTTFLVERISKFMTLLKMSSVDAREEGQTTPVKTKRNCPNTCMRMRRRVVIG